jgi:hypothetical protein
VTGRPDVVPERVALIDSVDPRRGAPESTKKQEAWGKESWWWIKDFWLTYQLQSTHVYVCQAIGCSALEQFLVSTIPKSTEIRCFPWNEQKPKMALLEVSMQFQKLICIWKNLWASNTKLSPHITLSKIVELYSNICAYIKLIILLQLNGNTRTENWRTKSYHLGMKSFKDNQNYIILVSYYCKQIFLYSWIYDIWDIYPTCNLKHYLCA